MLHIEIGILAITKICKLKLEKNLSDLKRCKDSIKALGSFKARDEAINAFVEMGELDNEDENVRRNAFYVLEKKKFCFYMVKHIGRHSKILCFKNMMSLSKYLFSFSRYLLRN